MDRRRLYALAFFGWLVLTACQGPQTPKEAPPPGGVSGTSGGLATLVLNGETVAFIPKGSSVLPVSLGAGGAALTLGVRAQSIDLSFPADACAADPIALKVVCVGYGSSKVAVVSVTTHPLSYSVQEFDLGNTTTASFSGGDCLNCGVLTDPGDGRFIVASGDGYRVLDYDGNLLKSYLDPRYVTENFGYDYRENRILAPEYAELPETEQRLWVIDLDENKVYRWNKRMTDVPGVPSGFLADAAAIDHETGLLAIGNEWSPGLLFVDLKNATWKPDGTFTAEANYQPLTNVFSNSDWLTTGLAVESQHHLAFFEEEFGNAIGAARLPDAPGVPGSLEYTSAPLGGLGHPDIPDACQLWENVGDPHGLALFVTPGKDKPMGLVVNDARTCLAIVDLQALLSAPKADGENRVDRDYDLVTNHVVKYMGLF